MNYSPAQRYSVAAVAQLAHHDHVYVVLPLTEPLLKPAVMQGSGAIIWEHVLAAGASGISAEDLTHALSVGSPIPALAILRDIQTFLDEAVALGVLATNRDR